MTESPRTGRTAGGLSHCVARAGHGTVLFRTWAEGRELWDRIVAACPGLVALVIMPDHVHVLAWDLDTRRLAAALRGYAIWRNAARGEHGRVWDPMGRPERIPNPSHARRVERYIHLNPCRYPRLVDDPLAWPLSTLRDAVGLALDPVRAVERDVRAYLAYVTSDPDVAGGCAVMPASTGGANASPPDLDAVAAAASALARVPVSRLARPGRARALFVAAARRLASCRSVDVAARLGLDGSRVRRSPPIGAAAMEAVETIVGDPRFPALDDRDLRGEPAWEKYRFRT